MISTVERLTSGQLDGMVKVNDDSSAVNRRTGELPGMVACGEWRRPDLGVQDRGMPSGL